MKLKEFINTNAEYDKAVVEIKEWVEQSYPGLSIEFDWPAPEIVRTDESVNFTKRRIRNITEAVNIKIGDVLEKYAESIYIAERLDRIYEKHPEFNIEVESIEDIKRNPQFLIYLDELIVRA